MISQSSELIIAKHLQRWASNWCQSGPIDYRWAQREETTQKATEAGCSQGPCLNAHGKSWFPGSGMVPGNHGTCWCFIRSKVSAAGNQQILEDFCWAALWKMLVSFFSAGLGTFLCYQDILVFRDTECWLFICCNHHILPACLCKNTNDGL